jgi:hypothetical protein
MCFLALEPFLLKAVVVCGLGVYGVVDSVACTTFEVPGSLRIGILTS